MKKFSPLLAPILIGALFVSSAPDVHAAKIRGKRGKKAYPNVIDKTLNAAAKCTPKSDAKQFKFCTGFQITNKEVDTLVKDGRAGCESRIRNAGYEVASNNDAQKIPQDDWKDFIESSQIALTFHNEKVVAFKTQAGFVDCAHEWIHVLQQTKAKDKLLSPRARAQNFKTAEIAIREQADNVEKLEADGKKAHAIIQAGKAQEAIDRLREFSLLEQTLDETEAHFFILRSCERLKCTDEDRETALANLYRRKETLSPQLRLEVETKARDIIESKKKVAIEAATKLWKPLDEAQVGAFITEKFGQDWKTLIKKVKAEGMRIIVLESALAPAAEFGEKIPLEILKDLDRPTAEDQALMRESKILTGGALAKFLCTGDKNFKPAILVTPSTTRAAIVHESLHFKQSVLNADYCATVFGQREVDAAFNSGKLDRKTHDQKLLLAQALNAIAEKEVYTLLLKHRDLLGKPESMNNELMLRSYEEWLGLLSND